MSNDSLQKVAELFLRKFGGFFAYRNSELRFLGSLDFQFSSSLSLPLFFETKARMKLGFSFYFALTGSRDPRKNERKKSLA